MIKYDQYCFIMVNVIYYSYTVRLYLVIRFTITIRLHKNGLHILPHFLFVLKA